TSSPQCQVHRTRLPFASRLPSPLARRWEQVPPAAGEAPWSPQHATAPRGKNKPPPPPSTPPMGERGGKGGSSSPSPVEANELTLPAPRAKPGRERRGRRRGRSSLVERLPQRFFQPIDIQTGLLERLLGLLDVDAALEKDGAVLTANLHAPDD